MNTAIYKLDYYENSGYPLSAGLKRRLDPKQATKRKEFVLPESDLLFLSARAKALGISSSEYIRSLIKEDMKKAL